MVVVSQTETNDLAWNGCLGYDTRQEAQNRLDESTVYHFYKGQLEVLVIDRKHRGIEDAAPKALGFKDPSDSQGFRGIERSHVHPAGCGAIVRVGKSAATDLMKLVGIEPTPVNCR